MNSTANEVDGNLPAALDKLHAAVTKLVDPVKAMNPNGPVLEAPSMYGQLVSEVPASSGGGDFRAIKQSKLPVWADALDLLREIDVAVAAWQPDGDSTPSRLRVLAAKRWRPQDVKRIEQIAVAVESWAAAISALLDPPRRWTLPSPCPACGVKIVYRQQHGERVRQPALQIGPNGCECANCHTVWAPDRFTFLAKLLGCLPDGVLE